MHDPQQHGPVDFHSHLVPDVDDGARGIEGALQAVGRMVDVGFQRILTTPHLDASLQAHPEEFDARVEEVQAGFEFLKEGVEIHFPGIEMLQGFEVMLDVPDPDFTDERLRLADTHFALVEWPRLQVPPGTARLLNRMKDHGVRPVIAHPERYSGVEQMGEIARDWVDAGALLQVNWGSLVGRYGASAKRVAFRLLRSGLVSYLASDFHGREHMPLNFQEARQALHDAEAWEAFRVLTETNPRRLTENLEPLPVPLVAEESGFLARVKRMIGGGR